MKAIVIDKPYSVIIAEVEKPKPKRNEVLIKVSVSGICGSDIYVYKGIHPFRKSPVVIGHEVAGELVEIGEEVHTLKLGQRVTVEPQAGCGSCEACSKGHVNYCSDRRAPGIHPWLGAMAEYFVAPESSVLVLPDELSYEEGVLAEPLAVGVHAVEKADIQTGDRVAVIGTGPIGLCTIAAAKVAGAGVVVATDIMDYCLGSALECGADNMINSKDQSNWTEQVKQMLGGEADHVFITAGVKGIVSDSLELLKNAGKIVVIAMFHHKEEVDIAHIQRTEKEIIGTVCYTRKDMKKAIELLASKQVNANVLISHVFPYDQAGRGFEIVEKKWEQSIKVLIQF